MKIKPQEIKPMEHNEVNAKKQARGLNAYIKKLKVFLIIDLATYLWDLESQEEVIYKKSKRQQIITLRAKINKTETKNNNKKSQWIEELVLWENQHDRTIPSQSK